MSLYCLFVSTTSQPPSASQLGLLRNQWLSRLLDCSILPALPLKGNRGIRERIPTSPRTEGQLAGPTPPYIPTVKASSERLPRTYHASTTTNLRTPVRGRLSQPTYLRLTTASPPWSNSISYFYWEEQLRLVRQQAGGARLLKAERTIKIYRGEDGSEALADHSIPPYV